jgi:YggT family protein
MQSVTFLIQVVFDLYIMVVLMRIWLQAARADFYNPFSQFVVKATQPFVAPLRRVIPSVGSLDLATIVFAYLVTLLKYTLLVLVASAGAVKFDTTLLLLSALSVVKQFGHLVFWVLIIRAIMSWVSQGRSPIEYVFSQLSEPFLAPIRRLMPDLGGIDLSLLIVIILLQFANMLMGDFLGNLWYMA